MSVAQRQPGGRAPGKTAHERALSELILVVLEHHAH